MAHGILDEIVGLTAAGFATYMAAKAKQSAEGGAQAKLGDAAKDVLKQRLPKMFGIGRADEQMFESLRQLVTDKAKRHYIDLVVDAMEDYEAGIWRLTVTGMDCGKKVVKKPVRNRQKGQPKMIEEIQSFEFTSEDLRVKYLLEVADEVAHNLPHCKGDELAASAAVVLSMRARRLITRDPLLQQAIDLLADDETAKRINAQTEKLVRAHPETLAVVGGEVTAQVPGVFSLMANDVKGFFNAIFRRRP